MLPYIGCYRTLFCDISITIEKKNISPIPSLLTRGQTDEKVCKVRRVSSVSSMANYVTIQMLFGPEKKKEVIVPPVVPDLKDDFPALPPVVSCRDSK